MRDISNKKVFSIFSIITVVLATIATVACLKLIKDRYALVVPPAPRQASPPPKPSFVSPPNSQLIIPNSYLLNVPFTPQAPTYNWDELHGEACEEASAIMANLYFNPDEKAFFASQDNEKFEGDLDPAYVEKQIQLLSEWQQEHFGYHLDINAEETAEMVREVYGLNAQLKWDFTEQDIKKEITQGNLILFPAQGQQLGNPNFRRPGPPYHMLVIRGYNSQGIVTNDPGTKRGANYTYTFDVLHNANGNWDHEQHAVDTNKKVIIIVSDKNEQK